jgi:adenosylhomocysteine nucleosidase
VRAERELEVGRKPLAIVSAMHQELHALIALLEAARRVSMGEREFHTGRMYGQDVVLGLSGIGKVAAAVSATIAIQHFGARALVFTGVAGGLGDAVAIGDLVLARELLQHDLDASPLFPRYEVPLTGRSRFAANDTLSNALQAAAQRCIARGDLTRSDARGLVISGDRFIASADQASALRAALPDALAVEMEGAAVAQVCAAFDTPFAVLRTISDRADDAAHGDFAAFIVDVASVVTRCVVQEWLAGREIG